MAGHSQFKNIMFRKNKQDAQKSKLFSKLSREITVAAKQGMPDPVHNPRLRAAIIAAKQQSMSKDVIDRAIKKSQGGDAENYEEMRYEGFGPGGVAIIVEALTDNRNRTAADVRHLFSKHGGNLGATGAVAWQFERRGIVLVAAAGGDEDEDGNPIFDATSVGATGDATDLYQQAVQIVMRDQKASTSYIQRRLQIGYNRAASIMERMEQEGVVGQPNHAGKREILLGQEPRD